MVIFAVFSLENFTKLMFIFFPHAVYGAFSCINSKRNSKLPKISSIFFFKLIFPSEIDVLLADFYSLELALASSWENCVCQYTSMYESILNCGW